MNGKIWSPEMDGLVQQFEIGHGQEAVLLFKTLGKVGWAAESRFKSYL